MFNRIMNTLQIINPDSFNGPDLFMQGDGVIDFKSVFEVLKKVRSVTLRAICRPTDFLYAVSIKCMSSSGFVVLANNLLKVCNG